MNALGMPTRTSGARTERSARTRRGVTNACARRTGTGCIARKKRTTATRLSQLSFVVTAFAWTRHLQLVATLAYAIRLVSRTWCKCVSVVYNGPMPSSSKHSFGKTLSNTCLWFSLTSETKQICFNILLLLFDFLQVSLSPLNRNIITIKCLNLTHSFVKCSPNSNY